MPLASIADLPNELLVDIFEYPTFPTEALYFLALLCRRLHLVALPIYFSRNGIHLEKKSATITLGTDKWDSLSALQICLFISSMEHVSCIFPHPSCTTVFPIIAQMKRLRTFISQLSFVGKVTLNLDSTGHGRSRCLSTGTDEDLKDWTDQYGALLNCIVQKGCKSLTVLNGGQLTETYQLEAPGWSERFLSRAVQRFSPSQEPRTPGFGRKFGRGLDIRLQTVPSSTMHHLNSLHLHSATLLVAPGLDWTLSALLHCPVTSLTICMSRVGGDTRLWRKVLRLIASAAPNLTTLSLIEVARHNEPAAFAFLAHLSHLTDLDLDLTYPLCDPSGPICLFKSLVTLRAAPSVVDYLLARVGPGSASFRAIRSITVVWNPSLDTLLVLIRPMVSVASRLRARGIAPQITVEV
ncbi:hypothetical protein DFH08DRAFT_974664 [Mycena albidolilacea]|uniref:F-box domain-containing protein n=1 Tax=Mycena albidolilacea TaxID=1033008 RepID=A0AAD6Z652_9AGAR|nr:hypothetical protein DFH08DRAFT_974664 [Mycena albidolilacea]